MRHVICCRPIRPLQVARNRLERRNVNQMQVVSFVTEEVWSSTERTRLMLKDTAQHRILLHNIRSQSFDGFAVACLSKVRPLNKMSITASAHQVSCYRRILSKVTDCLIGYVLQHPYRVACKVWVQDVELRLRCTTWGIPPNIVVIRPGIMHQHPEFTYLVDVLAVDFEIVDGLGGLMEGEMQDNCGTGVALERLALGQLSQRDPVAAVQ